MRRTAFAAGLTAVSWTGTALAGQPAAARLVVYGTILSIDRKSNTVMIRHAALETVPAGQRRCRFRHPADAARFKPGAEFQASADTSHQTWILDEVRIRT